MEDQSLEHVARAILEAAQSNNYRALAAAALTGLVWFLRAIALRPTLETLPFGLGRLVRWLKTDRGGVWLTLSLAVSGGLGTALAGHVPVTPGLIISGLVNGALAAGVFSMGKRIMLPPDQADKRAARKSAKMAAVAPPDSPEPPPTPPEAA